MGIEGAFLRKLPGLVFITLAVLSQWYLGRRSRVSRKTLWRVIGVYLGACLFLELEVLKDPPRPINYYLDRMGASLMIWGWLADFTAIVFFSAVAFTGEVFA